MSVRRYSTSPSLNKDRSHQGRRRMSYTPLAAGCVLCSICHQRRQAFLAPYANELRAYPHGTRFDSNVGYVVFCAGSSQAGEVFGQPSLVLQEM